MRRYPHKQNPASRGFTLVEVMVVVVIIGMLAAILVPVLGGIIRRTNEAAVKVEINSLENAIADFKACLLYTSPSPRDRTRSRMPSSA